MTEDNTEKMPDQSNIHQLAISIIDGLYEIQAQCTASTIPYSQFKAKQQVWLIDFIEAELDRRVAEAENNHTFCPHCKPCKNAELITNSEDVMREIACRLGVGGYNTDKFDPETFKQKIMAGIDLLVSGAEERQRERCAEVYEMCYGPQHTNPKTKRAILNAGGQE